MPLNSRTPIAQTKEIVKGTGQSFPSMQFGKTMVLYRSEDHRLLELLRALSLERVSAMIQAIVRGFAARNFVRKVRFVLPKLETAVASRDVEKIDVALKEYVRVCGQFSTLVADVGIVQKAKRIKYALQQWEKLCLEMDSLVRMDVPNDDAAFEGLKSAVWKAEELLDEPGSQWHQEMYAYSKDLFETERANRLDPQLAKAMDLLERDLMSEVYAECKRLRYEDPRLKEIEEFTALNEEKLLKLQYKKAKSLGLAQRAQDKEIKIREMFLDQHGAMFTFQTFPRLRQKEEYATHSLQFWKREDFATNMLVWTKSAVLTSLTETDSSTAKLAVKMHKSILGFCGDRNNPHPNSLAHDLVLNGINNKTIADEIYCQLMKQLTANPDEQSLAQAWRLLGKPKLGYRRSCSRNETNETNYVLVQRPMHAVLPAWTGLVELRPRFHSC